MRRRVLGMSRSVVLHVAPAYSCLDILDTIYFGLMRRGKNEKYPDTFLLSKGHGAVALYVILEEAGILSSDELNKYCTPQGRLGSHPDYGLPGIEASTGSLGHGLGMAVGMAKADKVFGQDRCIYVLMSDGELQEGSVWEALMLAPTLRLTNIVGFVDLNDFQSLGRTSEVHPNFYPLKEKIEAFGWEVAEVNGHDQEQIYNAVRGRSNTKPLMVIARTTKGKGVSYMENQPIWHYRSPSPEEYVVALRELGGEAA